MFPSWVWTLKRSKGCFYQRWQTVPKFLITFQGYKKKGAAPIPAFWSGEAMEMLDCILDKSWSATSTLIWPNPEILYLKIRIVMPVKLQIFLQDCIEWENVTTQKITFSVKVWNLNYFWETVNLTKICQINCFWRL